MKFTIRASKVESLPDADLEVTTTQKDAPQPFANYEGPETGLAWPCFPMKHSLSLVAGGLHTLKDALVGENSEVTCRCR